MSSSSKATKMTRRSRASSTRSNAPSSDSGGDSIQISASNSQKHNDEVSDFKGSENVNESSGPDLAQLTTQQAENSRSPQVACNPPGERVEQIESHPAVNGIKPLQVQQRGGAVQSSSNDKDMSHGIEDKVHRVKIESDRTGWGRISDLIRQYDRDRVEDVKEDIDTLLVFAGLFSAVITTSYKTLQGQSEDTTNQILLQLSAQLASLTFSNNFINSILPPYTTSAFVPIRFSVLINTLWLLSLILALVTASLGILVKQWLHELMARDTQDPRRQVKLRFFREIGVQRWQVLEIAAALPLLLQLALLLFFIGLSAFFHNLNPIVTWVVTGVMILWLIFYLFMTFAPAFSSQCPYKTPILKGFLHRVRVGSHVWISSLGHVLYSHIPATWPTIKQRCKSIHDSLNTWSAAWMAHEETEVCKSDIWDLPTLICSQELLRGEQLDETIAHCFQYCDVRSLLRCFEHLSQGVGPDAQGVLPNIPQGFIDPAFQLFRSLMGTLVTPSDSIVALSRWYITSTYALLKSYDPAAKPNIPIPPTSLQILIRLINENATSAIFSILTMYSIRYHIMENYPRSVDSLFLKSQDGIGVQFLLNLITATRDIYRNLWNQSQMNYRMNTIVVWINKIRSDSDPAIPTDSIAFISTFVQILYFLVPQDVREEHRDILVEVMGELANIITDTDGSSWSSSRRECVIYIHSYFWMLGFRDGELILKLGELIRTWNPRFKHTRPGWYQ